MASYADYAAKIEDEIKEAAENTAARTPEVPKQFEGKSIEDVVNSYEELRKLQERQANELGALRSQNRDLTDKLVQSSQTLDELSQPRKQITIDDLYENPEAIIDQRVEEKVSKQLRDIQEWQRSQEARYAFMELERNHPDFRDKAKSPEMRNWIEESGYRKRLALAADNGDVQAATDLFDMYRDHSGAGKRKSTTSVRDVSLESGRTDSYAPVEKFSRKKLEEARIRRANGDREAEAWLAANANSIYDAYAEGRIVD